MGKKIKVKVVQAPYFVGENPDEKIAKFLIGELEKVNENELIVLPEYSMNDDERGGCSMIVAPNGKILTDLGKEIGSTSAEIDLSFKHVRNAGYGKGLIRNDEFINIGLRPDVFNK